MLLVMLVTQAGGVGGLAGDSGWCCWCLVAWLVMELGGMVGLSGCTPPLTDLFRFQLYTPPASRIQTPQSQLCTQSEPPALHPALPDCGETFCQATNGSLANWRGRGYHSAAVTNPSLTGRTDCSPARQPVPPLISTRHSGCKYKYKPGLIMRNPTLYQTRFAPQARLVVVQFLCKCSGGLTNSCVGGTVSEQSRFHGARPAVRARNTYHMIVRDRSWKR